VRRRKMDEAERAYKVHENRLRRMAARQELQLVKSRRRDPRAPDYSTYMITNFRGQVVAGERMSLDDVEEYLTSPPPPNLVRGGTT
jgi:hypothetical protein